MIVVRPSAFPLFLFRELPRQVEAGLLVLLEDRDGCSLETGMSGDGAFVVVNGFKLFYKVFGDSENTLLCLHGGPRAIHDYLLPLGDLSRYGLKAVLYDQLGCGKSEKPPDTSRYTIDHGADEVEAIRQTLDLGRISLFGNSYGGALALYYALKYQQNLKKLIICSGLASIPETVEEMRRLKTLLPKDVQDTMSRYEAVEDYQNPEYLKAVEVFYRNFVCRLSPWPDEVARTMSGLSMPVYLTMNGPNEFTIIGNLKDWDIRARLPEIHVPTLVTVGKYDEVTPKVAETIHRGIRDSKLVVFENSAHLAMWEERELFLRTVRDFLLKDEGRRP